jgi:hypothetical protein
VLLKRLLLKFLSAACWVCVSFRVSMELVDSTRRGVWMGSGVLACRRAGAWMVRESEGIVGSRSRWKARLGWILVERW